MRQSVSSCFLFLGVRCSHRRLFSLSLVANLSPLSIDAIYKGRIIYTPSSFLGIIPDHYKHKPISIYNPREGPLLNQYRLSIPRTRTYMEIMQFLVLLFLYLAVMAERNPHTFSSLEAAFSIYAFGWGLDQFATILEHGW
jgi:hypothetical protein